MKYTLFFFFIFSNYLYAQDQEEAEFNFSKQVLENIRDEIKSDKLLDYKIKKESTIQEKKVEVKNLEQARYQYPSEDHVWTFLTEYWLVKNAASLQWDFSHPDYGIEKSLENLLEKIGLYGKKFKILVLNSPIITHAALPGNKEEIIFLISLPFMRTLDLTKAEIALLLLEDAIRLEMSHFQKNLKVDLSFTGKNFMGKKVDLKKIEQILKRYTEVLTKEGFSYKQQYEITKKMDTYLKSNQEAWDSYLKMLKKINELIKKNPAYKTYQQLYPSPELQIQWLSGKKSSP